MVNNILGFWSTFGSVMLAIFMLLVMITVHEFGHYIAGKIFKFKINEFSIGFGPALFKKKHKKTDELFAIRLIPLGGYCAFEGEDGLDEESPAPEKEISAETQTAEVFTDVAVAPENQETVAEEKSTVGTPVKGVSPDAFTKKKPWQRIIVLVAGAFMNYVLALLMILIGFFAYGQSMIAVWKMDAPTEEYRSEYSLQEKDTLLEIEGKNLYLVTDIAAALNGKHAGDIVEMRISRALELTEEGKIFREEEKVVSIMLRADVNVKNSAELDCVWRALGIANEDGVDQLATRYYDEFGFFETLGRSFAYSFKIAGSIFKVLGELLTGQLGISALGGPITTISMTSQMVSRGFRSFLEIGSFIGVNLAVFNLLPIPALDGSKVVFTAIEWVRGKPISRKVEAIIHAVGFILLLGFAVLVDFLQFI